MEFTSEWLGRYLSHRLGQEVTGLSLEKFTRGTSRQTWFGSYQAGGVVTEIVLRTDHPAGAVDPTPLDQEHFIYERLGGAGVPVARVLWWEDAVAWSSRPFYIREKIEGSWNIPNYSNPDPAFDDLRIAVAKDHLRTLAKVHALDWRALGFGERLAAPASEAEAGQNYVGVTNAHMAERDGEPMPIFAEISEWLRDNAPVASRISLCKGTNGLGEEVFRDGRLVALSDWEEVSIGDPASDFAFVQNFLDPIIRDGTQVWGMAEGLAFYNGISGAPPVAIDSVRYYQAIRAVKMLVMGSYAAALCHESDGAATIRQAWTATEVLHLCKYNLAAAMGLAPALPPLRMVELNATVDML